MASVPWPDVTKPRPRRVAEFFRQRSGGRTLDPNSEYAYEAGLILAGVLERAARLDDPDATVDALRQTRFEGAWAVHVRAVQCDELGDHLDAVPVVIQVPRQRPVVVWPRAAAVEPFVFPRPRP